MTLFTRIRVWISKHEEQNTRSGYIILFSGIVIIIALLIVSKCFTLK